MTMVPKGISSNLNLVQKTWSKSTAGLDARARAMRDEMALALQQLAKEQIEGKRGYSLGGGKGRDTSGRFTAGAPRVYEKAVSGQPPMNRTGDLRRSISAYRYRIGFGTYAALVGPTIVYGRAVELGGKYGPPTWRNGEHFPYMRPAYDKFRTTVVPLLMTKYFGKGGKQL